MRLTIGLRQYLTTLKDVPDRSCISNISVCAEKVLTARKVDMPEMDNK